MPVTSDDQPGARVEEEVQFEDRTASGNPTVVGAVRLVSDDLVILLSTGVVSLTTGSGLSAGAHAALRQLVHFIDNGPAEGFASGAYRETTGTVFPTAVIWYDQAGAGKKKIVEKLITWTGVNATTIVWKVYDAAETLLVTLTDAITYSGVFETSRTRTIA